MSLRKITLAPEPLEHEHRVAIKRLRALHALEVRRETRGPSTAHARTS